MYRRRVSKGGNISPILEGDESIELGNIHLMVLNNMIKNVVNMMQICKRKWVYICINMHK